MRKLSSYIKKYGVEIGTKYHRLLQKEANAASQVKKFKNKHGI